MAVMVPFPLQFSFFVAPFLKELRCLKGDKKNKEHVESFIGGKSEKKNVTWKGIKDKLWV